MDLSHSRHHYHYHHHYHHHHHHHHHHSNRLANPRNSNFQPTFFFTDAVALSQDAAAASASFYTVFFARAM